MRKTSIFIFFLTFLYCTSSNAKIYDCFLFFNELDLLEVRLNELYNHVDKFVLVECSQTFTGKPKPLFFLENKEKFSHFMPKIIHVIVKEKVRCEPWQREEYQRNQICRALMNCNDTDIILISDLDEIPSARRLDALIEPIITSPDQLVAASQTHYGYRLNKVYSPLPWHGTVVTSYMWLKKHTPNIARFSRTHAPSIPDTGWHFSWIGGIEYSIKKIESISHTELDNPSYKNRQVRMQDFFQGSFISIDDTFPEYIQKNKEFYERIGLIYYPDCPYKINLPEMVP
jgi:hypothetical protein